MHTTSVLVETVCSVVALILWQSLLSSFSLVTRVVVSILSLCLWSGKFRSVCFAGHQGGFQFDPFKSQVSFSLLVQPVVGYREGRAVPTQWESNDSSVWLLQRALSTHGFTAHGLITQLYIDTWTHYTLTCYTCGPIPANKWCLMTTWL